MNDEPKDNIRMIKGANQSTAASRLIDVARIHGDDMKDFCLFFMSQKTMKPVILMTSVKIGHTSVFAAAAQSAAQMALGGQLGE